MTTKFIDIDGVAADPRQEEEAERRDGDSGG